MPKIASSLLALATLPALTAIASLPASAQAPESIYSAPVTMFDRPPSVDELRSIVQPDKPIRTRGIEILGDAVGAGKRNPQADAASLAAPPSQPAAQPPMPDPVQQMPAETLASAPPLPPEPAPQPYPAAVPAAAAAPATAEPAAAQPGIFGFPINFAFDSADIPAEFRSYIDAVGALMHQEPQLALLVEGHTDAVGSDAYNQTLSQRRAAAVQQYLVSVHGIEPQRLMIQGKGEGEPLARDPYDGSNRRVEFERIQ